MTDAQQRGTPDVRDRSRCSVSLRRSASLVFVANSAGDDVLQTRSPAARSAGNEYGSSLGRRLSARSEPWWSGAGPRRPGP